MHVRQPLAKTKDQELAPFAVKNVDSWRPEGIPRRQYPEEEHPDKLPFQRDRDRVIHCNAFRRLKHKTQVFISLHGDHYRDRLTHSLEVAQIARSIARQLSINEDLAETLALAHDLGHPPFGHAGADTIDEIMQKFGERFEHNLQSKRIVEVLETRYPDFPGLNLTWEVRQGLMKHQSPWEDPHSREPAKLSLEAQAVDYADAIAYQAADLDDGLRSHILSIDDLKEVPLWREMAGQLQSLYPAINIESDIGRYQISRLLINRLVTDIVSQAKSNLAAAGIDSVEKVYQSQKPLVSFSQAIDERVHQLKNFLYKNFYSNQVVLEQRRQGQFIIKDMFERFYENPELLPPHIQKLISHPYLKHVIIKDYIAGMTDNFSRLTWQNLIER